MKRTNEDRKNLERKAFPARKIYAAVFSVTCRLSNYWKRAHRCSSLAEAIEYEERYEKREKRYFREREVLLNVLDFSGISDGYREYKRQRPSRALHDLMSAQLVTDMTEIIMDGEYEVIMEPENLNDNGKRGDKA